MYPGIRRFYLGPNFRYLLIGGINFAYINAWFWTAVLITLGVFKALDITVKVLKLTVSALEAMQDVTIGDLFFILTLPFPAFSYAQLSDPTLRNPRFCLDGGYQQAQQEDYGYSIVESRKPVITGNSSSSTVNQRRSRATRRSHQVPLIIRSQGL